MNGLNQEGQGVELDLTGQRGPAAQEILVRVSFGELVDKISILRLKERFISAPQKLALVSAELAGLEGILARLHVHERTEILSEIHLLAAVNHQLWDIENALRAHEARQDFGADFVTLARSVYTANDERARIKARLNALYGSRVVEVKSYGQQA